MVRDWARIDQPAISAYARQQIHRGVDLGLHAIDKACNPENLMRCHYHCMCIYLIYQTYKPPMYTQQSRA